MFKFLQVGFCFIGVLEKDVDGGVIKGVGLFFTSFVLNWIS